MPCGGSAPRGTAQILLYFLPFLWICGIWRQLLNQTQHFLTLFPGQRGQIRKKTAIHFHTEFFQNFISGHKQSFSLRSAQEHSAFLFMNTSALRGIRGTERKKYRPAAGTAFLCYGDVFSEASPVFSFCASCIIW